MSEPADDVDDSGNDERPNVGVIRQKKEATQLAATQFAIGASNANLEEGSSSKASLEVGVLQPETSHRHFYDWVEAGRCQILDLVRQDCQRPHRARA